MNAPQRADVIVNAFVAFYVIVGCKVSEFPALPLHFQVYVMSKPINIVIEAKIKISQITWGTKTINGGGGKAERHTRK